MQEALCLSNFIEQDFHSKTNDILVTIWINFKFKIEIIYSHCNFIERDFLSRANARAFCTRKSVEVTSKCV